MHRVNARYLRHKRPKSGSLRDLQTVAETLRDSSEAARHQFRLQSAKRLWTLRRQALRRARQQGQEQAKKAWGDLIAAAQQEYTQVMRSANRDCLELVLGIASRFVEAHLDKYTEHLCRQIDEALLEMSQEVIYTLVVHPEEQHFVQQHLKHFPANSANVIIGDDSIELGCAALKTRSGELYFSWRDNFQLVANEMKTQLELNLSEEGSVDG